MQLGPSGLTELERLHMEPNSERSVSQSPYSNHTVFACMSHTHTRGERHDVDTSSW